MKLDMTIPPGIVKAARSLFAHYGIISFILAMMTLIYCVFSIQIIFSAPSDQAYRDAELQKNTKTSFDKKTIDKIDQLRTTQDNAQVQLPGGRINPFTE